jgi:predicted HAD superfamily Cof-like phosphohydrolase
MADSIYVIVGAAIEYGIPLAAIWQAVQDSNMLKVDPTTGKVIRREDAKILKPPNWQPPDIERILANALNT